jgi:hypothetical protein
VTRGGWPRRRLRVADCQVERGVPDMPGPCQDQRQAVASRPEIWPNRNESVQAHGTRTRNSDQAAPGIAAQERLKGASPVS